jgi:hypothetical protein
LSEFTEADLVGVESAHSEGMTVQQIVAALAAHGEKLTEATFRKYVQLGLLPRSVRVGRKGKHRGSQGLYPATIVRQIDLVRRLMAQGHTIEDIQREFLFVRGDIDALARQLAQVLSGIERVAAGSAQASSDEILRRAVQDARAVAEQLIGKLRAIEQRLSMRARMARAVV